jgi:heat shock protein HslJ
MAVMLTLACASPSEEPQPFAGSAGMASPGPAPTIEELANATYIGLTGLEDDPPVTLEAGSWVGEAPPGGGESVEQARLSEGFYLTGDVDGDGADEAIVHLTFTGGGSGTFGYLAVMSREGDEIVQEAIGFVGDRVQIRSGRVDGADIFLNVLQAGPDDGLCCPSELATRAFSVRGGELVETGSEVTGTASMATLEGTEWVLRELSEGEDAPAEPELTLVFDDGRLFGSSGCNSYSGSVEQAEFVATALAVGPLASTRMACPDEIMDIEQRYLAALQSAGAWGFGPGHLLIQYGTDETFGTLVFEGRPLPAEQ